MPQLIDIPTSFPTFDGTVTVRFISEDGSIAKTFENLDAALTYDDINSTLNENERVGLPFLQALRRYIEVKFGVTVNIHAAYAFYKGLKDLLDRAENFFLTTSAFGGSTQDAIPDPSPPSSEPPPSV